MIWNRRCRTWFYWIATYLLYFVDSEGNRSVKSLPSISLLLWMSLTYSDKIGRHCYGINNREQKLP